MTTADEDAPDRITEAIAGACGARDLSISVSSMRLIAIRDPEQACRVLNAIAVVRGLSTEEMTQWASNQEPRGNTAS